MCKLREKKKRLRKTTPELIYKLYPSRVLIIGVFVTNALCGEDYRIRVFLRDESPRQADRYKDPILDLASSGTGGRISCIKVSQGKSAVDVIGL